MLDCSPCIGHPSAHGCLKATQSRLGRRPLRHQGDGEFAGKGRSRERRATPHRESTGEIVDVERSPRASPVRAEREPGRREGAIEGHRNRTDHSCPRPRTCDPTAVVGEHRRGAVRIERPNREQRGEFPRENLARGKTPGHSIHRGCERCRIRPGVFTVVPGRYDHEHPGAAQTANDGAEWVVVGDVRGAFVVVAEREHRDIDGNATRHPTQPAQMEAQQPAQRLEEIPFAHPAVPTKGSNGKDRGVRADLVHDAGDEGSVPGVRIERSPEGIHAHSTDFRVEDVGIGNRVRPDRAVVERRVP